MRFRAGAPRGEGVAVSRLSRFGRFLTIRPRGGPLPFAQTPMTYRAPISVLLALSAAVPAAAQRRAEPLAAAQLEAARFDAQAPALAPAAVRARRGPGARRTAVNVLAGALIGAGAGYLASQVAWSDWDKSSNSEFSGRRLNFALGGGALGAVGGLLLGHGGAAGRMGPGAPVRIAARSSVISEEEVRTSTAETLFQLVQELRPFWLRREGATGHTNPPAPDSEDPPAPLNVADDAGVRVYIERGFVGDIWSLREIALKEVTWLEFLDAATATYRLGQGNPSGAIVVHTGRAR